MIYNKVTLLLLATTAACSQAKTAIAGSLRKNRHLKNFDECVVVKSYVEYEDLKRKNQEVCSCLMENETGKVAELKGLNKKVCHGLNSLESKISSSAGFVFNELTQEASVPFGAMMETTTIEVEDLKSNRDRRRRLATGEKKVMVLRADANDSSTSANNAKLSEEVLGIGGNDAINLGKQIDACSYGQLKFVPATISGVTNGAYSVTIDETVNGNSNGNILGAMNAKWQEELGTFNSNNYNGDLDYVMFCIPPGTSGGWIAYAYINYWISAYNDNWCLYPSSQLHEMGHNIGLAHSGEGSNEYADNSGMMGYSYRQDEGPIMCYNAVKMFKLNWFPDYTEIVNGEIPYFWQGDMIGFVDRDMADVDEDEDRMIFLLSPENGNDEYYVSFNRARGFNSGTREASNQVTVTKRPRGLGYADSYIQAKLSSGGTYEIANFGDDGPLTITVGDITLLTATKSTAAVTIQYGDVVEPTDAPVPEPTDAPVPEPTEAPVPEPTDAPVPEPTDAPVPEPTDAPVPEPTDAPVPEPTDAPVPEPTDAPVPEPTDAPVPEPTDAPVPEPTDAPVPEPTDAPVPEPTDAPVPEPTDAPVPEPTDAPVPEPTDAPVPEPTDAPVSEAPVPEPTDAPVPEPTDAPIPEPEECIECTNLETPWMRRNDKDCETSHTILRKQCNKKAKWRNNKYCQLSCFVEGFGYQGDNCCIDPTPPPAPVAPEPCTQCTDERTPWMARNDKECDVEEPVLTNGRNCNKKAKWRNNKYCQLSCFKLEVGYAGDNCCLD